MRRKIAPTLKDIHSRGCMDCEGSEPCRACAEARRELRALLAVAHAAERMAEGQITGHLRRRVPDCKCRTCTSEVGRALIRLRGVSGGKGTRP